MTSAVEVTFEAGDLAVAGISPHDSLAPFLTRNLGLPAEYEPSGVVLKAMYAQFMDDAGVSAPEYASKELVRLANPLIEEEEPALRHPFTLLSPKRLELIGRFACPTELFREFEDAIDPVRARNNADAELCKARKQLSEHGLVARTTAELVVAAAHHGGLSLDSVTRGTTRHLGHRERGFLQHLYGHLASSGNTPDPKVYVTATGLRIWHSILDITESGETLTIENKLTAVLRSLRDEII